MKTCPECAESVQPAARKCRFCGHRFDGAEVAVTEQPVPTRSSASSSTDAPGWSYGMIACGAILVAIGAALVGIMALASITSQGMGYASFGALAGGGAVLGIGWCGMLPSGRSGFGMILGAFAIPAASIIAMAVSIPESYKSLRGLIWMAGIFLFVMSHYFAFAEGALTKLTDARGCAGLALFGIGVYMMAVSKRIPLPTVLASILQIVGLVGILLFGCVLAGTIGKLREPTRA